MVDTTSVGYVPLNKAGDTATNLVHDTGSIGTAVTAVTQAPSDNSTKVSTTAYADAAAAAAPGTGANTALSNLAAVAVNTSLLSAATGTLDLGSGANLWKDLYITTIELGHATDTTLTRASAGDMNIEGNIVYRAGGTNVAIADGGTNADNAAAGLANLGGQPLDATLTSLSALGTAADKYAYTTGIDTWAEGDITAAGRAILDDANAAAQRTTMGVAIGSDVQAYDATLDAFAAYNTNGLLTQTAADTFTGRTLTGTAAEITVTNGDGVAGNPTMSLPAALTFTGKTVTGGTFNTLDADIAVADGGTGLSSATAYAVLCGGTTGTNPFQSIASVGTAGHVLTSNGAGALPTFQAAGGGAPTGATYITQTANGTLTNEQALDALATGLMKNTTGTGVVSIAAEGTDYYGPGGTDVAVADGGTGRSSHTAYAVICGGTGATTAQQSIASVGTSGQVLTSNGAGALPTFQAASGGGGKVLQVVQATKTDTQTINAGAWTDITSLSVSITPASTSNKILVLAQVSCAAYGAGSSYGALNLVRDSTDIFQGDAGNNRTRSTGGFQSYAAAGSTMGTICYLDSPASVSSLTYKVQAFDVGGTVYINRTNADTDSATYVRMASSIIVMEIDGT